MEHQSPARPAAMDSYLRRLRFALAPLPPEARDEIVREIRSHFMERLDGAADPERAFRETAAAMGPAEEYARSFVDDYRIAAAVAGGSGFAMLHVALRLAGRGIRALLGVAVLLLVFTIALALVIVALLKPIFPAHVGAWYAPEAGIVAIGFLDARTAAQASELLGYWIIPIAILASTVLYRVGTTLLRRFLRWHQTPSVEP